MERKIGETFEYEGKKLKVVEEGSRKCKKCFFYVRGCFSSKDVRGFCLEDYRTDKKNVIFVKTEEQPQEEHKEIKERKVGEVFEYEGKKIRVEESCGCDGCFFEGRCSSLRKKVTGYCEFDYRTDDKDVIFVEITEEQPQEQAEQPQKLNLCEILKYCPQGETFWSPLLGDVKLCFVESQVKKIIVTLIIGGAPWEINANGTITINDITSEEIMLYPSREQRDWTKVKYEPRKERFDPKTLKAYDKVLVRNVSTDKWGCSLFSNISVDTVNKFHCVGLYYKCCIPYNDDTKHLVGTTDEAPEYYRYWED